MKRDGNTAIVAQAGLVLLLLGVSTSQAQAAVEVDFIDNFTTAESANTHQTPADPFANPTFQNVFDLSETPYLYLETPARDFPNPISYQSTIFSKWYFNSVEKYSTNGPGDLNQNEFFFTPPNWDTIKEPGLWAIDSSYELRPLFNPSELTAFGGSSTDFTVTGPTVTPEPVSMALFGLGAGALALSRRKRYLR